ncbi:anthrone oxygenase family protein [Rhodococcus maanshanensis]|uniref:Uncharacterized membrane protein n=1 Tax=Rhodococcus maanshanensis TaxID=183556 RepID=A0A1H7VT13_9NOCA|nr:anthrone oxygenase family protein [Rhodococcus maanshanensis]SEM11947.1 Uncharacterized membrane protein [Rhodococcus maanshanensis]
MTTKFLQTITLLGASVTAGLMAGLFAAFAYAVMPGLGRTDNLTFISAMQRINVAILNGWFMICFLGALALTVTTLLLHLGSARSALPWIIAALVLYIAMLVITAAINVPLNDQLAAAGEHITDPGAVREQFESRWVTWNIVRAVVSTAAFAALAYALVVHGQATATDTEASALAAGHAAPAPQQYPAEQAARPSWMYPADQVGNGGNRGLPAVTDGR